MNEKYLLLERQIERDWEAVERFLDQLAEVSVDSDTEEGPLIITGYRLHHLYTAIENLFFNIARGFENQLEKDKGWHSQLLQRMVLDLQPIRPAVIDQASFELLDELRGFRHVFRTNYGTRLQGERMKPALKAAQRLRQGLPAQVEQFMGVVHALATEG